MRLRPIPLAALLLALAAAPAAADCEAMEVAVENQGAAPVSASLRQAASEDDWQVVEAAPGGSAVVPLCLEMVLSVASAEFLVQGGDGTEICTGSALIPQGAAASLVVAADGTCELKSR